MKKRIGIVIIGTNSYILLAVRFIKKFQHHYKGNAFIEFYLFTDANSKEFFSKKEYSNIIQIKEKHNSWRDATNSKFNNILELEEAFHDLTHVYYFDSDTDINKDFTEEWFISEGLVGGEHYGNRSFLSDGRGFDRNPIGHSYVPTDCPLPYTYYYGAFFGGEKSKVMLFCEKLLEWQKKDQKIGYEPPVNDESYINTYFHFNPPAKTVKTEEFAFVISDKGGIGETRNISLDVEDLKSQARENRNNIYDIKNGKIFISHIDGKQIIEQ